MTERSRSNMLPRDPQAAMSKSACPDATSSHVSFCGPIGFLAPKSPRGSVDLNANRLTMRTDPYPHDFAKPMHRRIVGSSTVSSAVDGFKPINATKDRESSHTRVSA